MTTPDHDLLIELDEDIFQLGQTLGAGLNPFNTEAAELKIEAGTDPHVHPPLPMDVELIKGDSTDTRPENLRLATNCQNQRGARSGSLTGLPGAHPKGGQFQSSIQVDDKRKHLWSFSTAEKAHKAYMTAKRELHPFGETAKDEVA